MTNVNLKDPQQHVQVVVLTRVKIKHVKTEHWVDVYYSTSCAWESVQVITYYGTICFEQNAAGKLPAYKLTSLSHDLFQQNL